MGAIFWSALVVGTALTAAGIAAQAMGVLVLNFSLLIACSGLGIILGAFGSAATIKFRGAAIAGAAAIAITLMFTFDKFTEGHVVINIEGDVKDATQATFSEGNVDHYVAMRKRSIGIAILAKSIDRSHLQLILTFPEEIVRSGEVIFGCIPKAEVDRYLRSGTKVTWQYHRKDGLLTKVDGKVIAREESTCGVASSAPLTLPSLIGVAHAQPSADVLQLLKEIQSPNVPNRRDARSSLAALGPLAVPSMMELFSGNPDNYRVRLGIAAALAEMTREKATAEQVARVLTADGIRDLVDAAIDTDRTLRIHASEALSNLHDPRSVRLVASRIDRAPAEGLHRLVLIIDAAGQTLDFADRREAILKLNRLQGDIEDRTRKLVDDVTQRLVRHGERLVSLLITGTPPQNRALPIEVFAFKDGDSGLGEKIGTTALHLRNVILVPPSTNRIFLYSGSSSAAIRLPGDFTRIAITTEARFIDQATSGINAPPDHYDFVNTLFSQNP
ncbi:MAG: hypothetical protein HQL42_04305 [Alphaproteobacteria bacterium]|nr:hypothetical protein [Alphaproteobacteria bacterium]